MNNQFKKWNGDYEKEFYDIKLPSGEVVLCCWPNAGKMCENGGERRKFTPEDNIEIRLGIHPLDR
jgi:hypothetical protein